MLHCFKTGTSSTEMIAMGNSDQIYFILGIDGIFFTELQIYSQIWNMSIIRGVFSVLIRLSAFVHRRYCNGEAQRQVERCGWTGGSQGRSERSCDPAHQIPTPLYRYCGNLRCSVFLYYTLRELYHFRFSWSEKQWSDGWIHPTTHSCSLIIPFHSSGNITEMFLIFISYLFKQRQ